MTCTWYSWHLISPFLLVWSSTMCFGLPHYLQCVFISILTCHQPIKCVYLWIWINDDSRKYNNITKAKWNYTNFSTYYMLCRANHFNSFHHSLISHWKRLHWYNMFFFDMLWNPVMHNSKGDIGLRYIWYIWSYQHCKLRFFTHIPSWFILHLQYLYICSAIDESFDTDIILVIIRMLFCISACN